MSSAAPAYPVPAYGSLRIPAAAFEVLAYLAAVAVATLSFLAGWLPVNGAVVLTVVLLTTLIVQSFIHLGQGRHPVFLFLCTLMLFQGGRLIGYCIGVEPEPMRVELMTPTAFSLSREDAGLVLLALALSAICVYAPCRWLYRPVAPPIDVNVRKYLPYLYLLFFATLPVQLFKNYRYYEYVQQHGGYTFIFMNHSALAASVPLWVRAIPLITFPVFVAIFVFERRKFPLYVATLLYFSTASFILLLGSRGAAFSLALALWWVSRIKTQRKTRIVAVAVFALLLLFVGWVLQKTREDDNQAYREFSAGKVVSIQGVSLNVTEMAVKYRPLFSPYFGSYMMRELQNAFSASDASNYYRGRALGFDVTVLLNPGAFGAGYGTSTSYLAEAYVGGSMIAVVLVSVAVGLGLQAFYKFSGNSVLVFLFAISLPEILLMPRGALLDWASVFAKNSISIVLLLSGWGVYSLITSIRQRAVGGI
jgi:hypothetical protein